MANEITIMNENLEKNLELKIMDDFYVLTFKDFNDDYKMYLCYINQDDDLIIYDDGFRTKIAKLIRNIDIDAEPEFYSEYGEIDSVINLKKLIVTYNVIKQSYNKEEIKEIIEAYRNNYLNLIDKKIIKKLELK